MSERKNKRNVIHDASALPVGSRYGLEAYGLEYSSLLLKV